MPMFYTPKPRQFKYRPRFYDPEKERWEALKQKYADEKVKNGKWTSENGDDELEYFQRRVRELDREKRQGLTWKDAFRKREMPTWNYQPRFCSDGEAVSSEKSDTPSHLQTPHSKLRTHMKRRFDISDTDYLKPVPAGRIMLYALLVCALLYWILF